jgi:hypothetical protein
MGAKIIKNLMSFIIIMLGFVMGWHRFAFTSLFRENLPGVGSRDVSREP